MAQERVIGEKMQVKVSQVGSRVTVNAELLDGATVNDALRAAELIAGDSTFIRVSRGGNSTEASLYTPLQNEDLVLLVPRVRGGADITVKVMRLGDRTNRQLSLPQGSTVADAIRVSGVNSSGTSHTVNSRPAAASQTLNDGDIVILTPKVEGGR